MLTSILVFIASVYFGTENWTMDEVTKTLYPKCSPVFLFIVSVNFEVENWTMEDILEKRCTLLKNCWTVFLLIVSVNFEAENWTMGDIAKSVPHVGAGGLHYPSHCIPR